MQGRRPSGISVIVSTGRSFRTRNIGDIVRWGENQAQIELSVDGQMSFLASL